MNLSDYIIFFANNLDSIKPWTEEAITERISKDINTLKLNKKEVLEEIRFRLTEHRTGENVSKIIHFLGIVTTRFRLTFRRYMTPIKISIVVPTYNNIDNLKVFIHSMKLQTSQNFEVIFVVDGALKEADLSFVGVFSAKDALKHDPKYKFILLKEHYNDWGQTPRELGKNAATGDYVIMTGYDNYYPPCFVQTLIYAITEDPNNVPDFVYWWMVHSHYDYALFQSKPAFNQIDIGSFATRTDLAKPIKLQTSYAADGLFVEEFKKTYPNAKYKEIKKVLYVHN